MSRPRRRRDLGVKGVRERPGGEGVMSVSLECGEGCVGGSVVRMAMSVMIVVVTC